MRSLIVSSLTDLVLRLVLTDQGTAAKVRPSLINTLSFTLNDSYVVEVLMYFILVSVSGNSGRMDPS